MPDNVHNEHDVNINNNQINNTDGRFSRSCNDLSINCSTELHMYQRPADAVCSFSWLTIVTSVPRSLLGAVRGAGPGAIAQVCQCTAVWVPTTDIHSLVTQFDGARPYHPGD
jgi:hypothetical protein